MQSTEIHPRLARERKTVEAMIRIFCRDHHGTNRRLCPECGKMLEYSGKRLEACPYGKDKPTCSNCPIHCYNPGMRERIREIMRYSGPRIIWRHPVLAAYHLVDGRRRAPAIPSRRDRPGK